MQKYLATAALLLVTGTTAYAAAPGPVASAVESCCAAVAACCSALMACCG